MREDFAALILTHGRPDNVKTLESLEKSGYTGRWYLIVDDEDQSRGRYIERFGKNRVIIFSKKQAAQITDTGDNRPDRGTVLFARNALWQIARDLGLRYFIELDDDYGWFGYRWFGSRPDRPQPGWFGWKIQNIDKVFTALVNFLAASQAHSVALSQGGDHMGGTPDGVPMKLKRKVMNSFVCDVDRPFPFLGRMNDDTTAYVDGGRRGYLFFTVWPLQLNQEATQGSDGGLTDMYLEAGTYVKTFYTCLWTPSAVKITSMGRQNKRLHHKLNWNDIAPKIVREQLRRTSA